jgi:serine/threonine-protein kinase HipA
MFHTPDGLRLTPAYDLVAAALYPEYHTLALAVNKAVDLKIEQLKPKHMIALGEAYGLDRALLTETFKNLDQRRAAAEKAVTVAAKKIGDEALGQKLLDFMERRWNGSFSLTGQVLSKRPSGGDTA